MSLPTIYQGKCVGGPRDGQQLAHTSRRFAATVREERDGETSDKQGSYFFQPSRGPDGPVWRWIWEKA
jgi:hypothetical protein